MSGSGLGEELTRTLVERSGRLCRSGAIDALQHEEPIFILGQKLSTKMQ